jgi:Aspartyl protease
LEIQDLLITVLDATSLAMLIAQASRLDLRLTERALARRNHRGLPGFRQQQSPYHNAPPSPDIAPMEVDVIHGQITPQEKERRRRNCLCFRCADPSHQANRCPLRNRPGPHKPPPRDVNAIDGEEDDPSKEVAAITPPHAQDITKLRSNFSLPLQMMFHSRKLPILALLDSGANGNYMDWEFAKRNGIPSIPKPKPVLVRTIDGSPLGTGQILKNLF